MSGGLFTVGQFGLHCVCNRDGHGEDIRRFLLARVCARLFRTVQYRLPGLVKVRGGHAHIVPRGQHWGRFAVGRGRIWPNLIWPSSFGRIWPIPHLAKVNWPHLVILIWPNLAGAPWTQEGWGVRRGGGPEGWGPGGVGVRRGTRCVQTSNAPICGFLESVVWRLAGIRIHVGKTQIWNQAGIRPVETDFGQTDFGPTDLGQTDFCQTDFGQTNFGQS